MHVLGVEPAQARHLPLVRVRMSLVPAVLTLLDRRAWWLPRWLDRILPVVDVEGERLRRTAPDRELVGAAR